MPVSVLEITKLGFRPTITLNRCNVFNLLLQVKP
jgi:hypothetical protein